MWPQLLRLFQGLQPPQGWNSTRVCHVSTPTPTPSHYKTQTNLFREVSVVCSKTLPSKTLNKVRDGERSSHSPGNTELSSVANTYSRRSQCSSQSTGTTQACWEACELLIVHHQLKRCVYKQVMEGRGGGMGRGGSTVRKALGTVSSQYLHRSHHWGIWGQHSVINGIPQDGRTKPRLLTQS